MDAPMMGVGVAPMTAEQAQRQEHQAQLDELRRSLADDHDRTADAIDNLERALEAARTRRAMLEQAITYHDERANTPQDVAPPPVTYGAQLKRKELHDAQGIG
jgi:hypothetical protein